MSSTATPWDTLRPVRAARAPVSCSIGLLTTVGFGVPLVIAQHYGALGIPRSDDWSYLLTLFRWVDTGHLSFNHWVSMTLVGQLLIAAPMAALRPRAIGDVQVVTAALGLVGLVCVALIPSRVTTSRWCGLFLAATIAVGPFWGSLAVSYMTDVPAFSLSMGAFLVGLKALDRDRPSVPLLIISSAIGLGAFTIRQYSSVVVVAVLVSGAWSFAAIGDRRALRRIGSIGVVSAIAMAGFLVWWNTVPDGRSLAPGFPTAHAVSVSVFKGAGFLRLIGLVLLPIVVAAGPVRIVRRSWRLSRVATVSAIAATAVWLSVSALHVPRDLFVGDYVMRDGVLSDIVLIGHRPDVFPTPIWWGIVGIASAAALIVVLAVVPFAISFVRRFRSHDFADTDPTDVYLTLIAAGYSIAYLGAMASGLQVYDRYILPALPAMGLLLLRTRGKHLTGMGQPEPSETWDPTGRRPLSRLTPWMAFVGLAAVGLAYTADSASFDGARWRVATEAVHRGWSPQTINGGFEWVNFQSGDLRRSLRRDEVPPICVTVHVDPSPAAKRIVAVVRSSAPTRETVPVVAFRTTRPCPSPTGPAP